MAVTHLHRFRADAKELREAVGGGGMAEGCGINFELGPLSCEFVFIKARGFQDRQGWEFL